MFKGVRHAQERMTTQMEYRENRAEALREGISTIMGEHRDMYYVRLRLGVTMFVP